MPYQLTAYRCIAFLQTNFILNKGNIRLKIAVNRSHTRIEWCKEANIGDVMFVYVCQ